MATVTRALLRNLARVYADGRPSGANAFIVDSDAGANAVSLDTLINLAIAKFYDMLVAARGHEYYAADQTIPLIAGTNSYALAADFYQLLTVHLAWGPNESEPVQDTSALERILYTNWVSWSRWAPKAFRLRGTQVASSQTLELFPTPTISGTSLIVRYVPQFAPLTTDVATFDSVNGWEKFIALAAAIDYRAASNKDAGLLSSLYAEELARIQGMADKRAANFAPQIIDVQPDRLQADWSGDRRWI